jgi:hypothetical protein
MPAPRALLAALLAAFALVMGAAAAGAETEVVRDPSGDVLVSSPPDEFPPTKPEPLRRSGDVVRTRVTFGADLVVTMKVRGLAPRLFQTFNAEIQTSGDDRAWTAQLMRTPDSSETFFFLYDPELHKTTCGTGTLHARKVTMVIPADCLGSPAWVRLASGTTYHVERGQTYYDDSRRDGSVGHQWKKGPRLTAG